MIIVGLCGKEGAGKTTAAGLLRDHYGATIVPFAAPLKYMLEALGVPPENLYGTLDDKNAPLDMLAGHSARHAMQTLGTEWGRRCLGPDFWAAIWRAKVENLAANMSGGLQPVVIVADDVRFGSEVDAVRAAGGIVLCVAKDVGEYARDRRRAKSRLWRVWHRLAAWLGCAPHASTRYAELDVDGVVMNDGSLTDLKDELAAQLPPQDYTHLYPRAVPRGYAC